MSKDGWCTPARGARRLGLAALGAAVLVAARVGSGASLGFTGPVSAQAAGSAGHPNRFGAATAARPVLHPGPAAKVPPAPKPAYQPPRLPAVPMQPALVPLDPVAGAPLLGSGGVLELTGPAGAGAAGGGGGAPGPPRPAGSPPPPPPRRAPPRPHPPPP